MSPRELAVLVQRWLANENGLLKEAVEKTVQENLFSRADVVHALRALRATVTEETLSAWLGAKQPVSRMQTTLVLHAGNLPLVGFQDVLAVLLSGNRYLGKGSRKDPYLTRSFIETVNAASPERIAGFFTSLEELKIPADHLLFSGSEAGAREVLETLKATGTVSGATRVLLRTASFSVAWFPSWDSIPFGELTEAMLRYNGRGCRSVAIVVCPDPLKANQCAIVDHTEAFWQRAGAPSGAPLSRLYHAYFRASGFPLTVVDTFMLVQTVPDPSVPFTVFYVQGGPETLSEITKKFAGKIQTVYSVDGRSAGEVQTEPLESAQTPPVHWKPDGTDTLAWLLDKRGSASESPL
jgi:hypothetical protein